MSGRQVINSLILVPNPEEDDYGLKHPEWVHYSEFINIELNQYMTGQTIYNAKRSDEEKILLLLGNDETCTPEFISEFARKYSLPTWKYLKDDPPNQFRRYGEYLANRNVAIEGFTEHKGNYYMVAEEYFYHWYS